MTGRIFAALGLVFAMTLPAMAAKEHEFAFYKNIERETIGQEDILSVVLDDDIYDATQKSWADIRIFNAKTPDTETPYRLEQLIEDRVMSVRKASFQMEILDLKKLDDNRIELIIRRAKGLPVDRLSFFTPLRDFERHVTIYGGDDKKEWHPLVKNALLFDYSRFVDLRNSPIELPPNKYRFYKVVIEEVTDQQQSPLSELTRQFEGEVQTKRTERTTVRTRPLRIDRIEGYVYALKTFHKQDQKFDYPIEFIPAKDTTVDEKEKQTILEVRTRRQPLTQFTLATDSANFSRRVTVLVPIERGTTIDWMPIGNDTISAIRFRGFEQTSLKVSFPEQRSEKYRIVIENRDSPPLAVTGVSAEGNGYRTLFFADKDAAYRLYYGSDSAKTPQYDTAPLEVTLKEGYQPVTAKLGPQVDNPTFGHRSDPRLKRILASPYFLGSIICLMVAVLAWILFRAGRRLEGLPEE